MAFIPFADNVDDPLRATRKNQLAQRFNRHLKETRGFRVNGLKDIDTVLAGAGGITARQRMLQTMSRVQADRPLFLAIHETQRGNHLFECHDDDKVQAVEVMGEIYDSLHPILNSLENAIVFQNPLDRDSVRNNGQGMVDENRTAHVNALLERPGLNSNPQGGPDSAILMEPTDADQPVDL